MPHNILIKRDKGVCFAKHLLLPMHGVSGSGYKKFVSALTSSY